MKRLEAVTTEARLAALLQATPAQLRKVDAALADNEPEPAPVGLLRMGEAARMLAVSRTTLWRMVAKDGKLPAVEIRPGTFRVPLHAVRELVGV